MIADGKLLNKLMQRRPDRRNKVSHCQPTARTTQRVDPGQYRVVCPLRFVVSDHTMTCGESRPRFLEKAEQGMRLAGY